MFTPSTANTDTDTQYFILNEIEYSQSNIVFLIFVFIGIFTRFP